MEDSVAAASPKKARIETIVVGDEPMLFVATDWSPEPKLTTMWMFSLPKDEEEALLKRKRVRGSILVEDDMLDIPSLSPNVESDGAVPVKRDGAGNVRLDAYAGIEMVVLRR